MERRDVLQLLSGLAVLGGPFGLLSSSASAQDANQAVRLGDPTDFTADIVRQQAMNLAKEPFKAREIQFPNELSGLSYDQYRDIRFKPEASIWRGDGRGFAVDLQHSGSIFKTPVDVFFVENGQARTVLYDPSLFTFGPAVTPPPEGTQLSYSGFRLRYPLNRPDFMDEFAVFQGASYFRAIGKNQLYGLSARGLAIQTGSPKGEEFPFFRSFWIERPGPQSRVIVVYALLDSQSTTGAYRFTIRPGDTTLIDVEMTLFPRVELDHVGFGPLTSMFLFDATNRSRFDDFRPAVHDNHGLAVWTGDGEWIWRPLANPTLLQISAFVDSNPRGFGLVQRDRVFDSYEDTEAHYERRPTCWVEPVGDWGRGHVELVEIPTDKEVNDNIVAYWRPATALKAGDAFTLTYRLHWGATIPRSEPIAAIHATRVGLNMNHDRRLFVIDITKTPELEGAVAEVTASAGAPVSNIVGRDNPDDKTHRVSFEIDTTDKDLIELRLRMLKDNKPVAETWLYRWTS
ncbi:glucans biosynthesis protein [Rhodoligotrophos appendicifer]|uniref:glucan biosynthesis protein n=1 Tax=Rhodoligotrophos appendicifer TaxID=987056 RepID=UPI00118629AF|nr:glucan biosynthesis protein [Rhodoligotrophos appendicifer]